MNDVELLAIIRRVEVKGDATIDLNEWTEFLRCKNMGPMPGPMPMGPLGAPHAFSNKLYEDQNAS